VTDDSNHSSPARLTTAVGAENNQARAVPVDKVAVDSPRRPLDVAKVAELVESIQSVGILNPIIVVVRTAEDGSENMRLVAGLHRLEAARRLGLATIQCTVLASGEDLRVELAEIDENLVRNNPSPAEHAMLTVRRGEILKKLAEQDGTLSQNATASRQAQRRAGQRPGHEVASVRDQAKRTGGTKDKIQRSRKRGRLLGPFLDRIRGTSLDKGAELDALAKLSKAEQEDLGNRAARGEAVSARTADRKPPAEVKQTRGERAFAEFGVWTTKYSDLKELAGVQEQIQDIYAALSKIEEHRGW
jgi:ParB family chromosome partitioning protein